MHSLEASFCRFKVLGGCLEVVLMVIVMMRIYVDDVAEEELVWGSEAHLIIGLMQRNKWSSGGGGRLVQGLVCQ